MFDCFAIPRDDAWRFCFDSGSDGALRILQALLLKLCSEVLMQLKHILVRLSRLLLLLVAPVDRVSALAPHGTVL